MGAHSKWTSKKVGTEQDIKVEEIIVHSNYNKPIRDSNDIALVKLAKPAKLGKGVGLACMPDPGLSLPVDDLNKKCWITGWGRLSSGGASPNNLMQIDVPLYSDARCKNTYCRGTIDDSMLCAGLQEGGVDSCQGDSGGPLVCELNGKWYLEGATSWGVGCGDPGYPGVYAKIRHLLSWVHDTTNGDVTRKFTCFEHCLEHHVVNVIGLLKLLKSNVFF